MNVEPGRGCGALNGGESTGYGVRPGAGPELFQNLLYASPLVCSGAVGCR